MRCRECGPEFGIFDSLIPLFQLQLHQGSNRDAVEPSGYAHDWHYKNQDPPDEG